MSYRRVKKRVPQRTPKGSMRMETRQGLTKSEHAWVVDEGKKATKVQPKQPWQPEHNRSDLTQPETVDRRHKKDWKSFGERRKKK